MADAVVYPGKQLCDEPQCNGKIAAAGLIAQMAVHTHSSPAPTMASPNTVAPMSQNSFEGRYDVVFDSPVFQAALPPGTSIQVVQFETLTRPPLTFCPPCLHLWGLRAGVQLDG